MSSIDMLNDTVDVSWVAGYPGNDLKTMSSYLYVERQDAAGTWRVVTTDKDPLNQQRNEERLRQVMRAIHELRPRPVAIVASGDLVDRGGVGVAEDVRIAADELLGAAPVLDDQHLEGTLIAVLHPFDQSRVHVDDRRHGSHHAGRVHRRGVVAFGRQGLLRPGQAQRRALHPAGRRAGVPPRAGPFSRCRTTARRRTA